MIALICEEIASHASTWPHHELHDVSCGNAACITGQESSLDQTRNHSVIILDHERYCTFPRNHCYSQERSVASGGGGGTLPEAWLTSYYPLTCDPTLSVSLWRHP